METSLKGPFHPSFTALTWNFMSIPTNERFIIAIIAKNTIRI